MRSLREIYEKFKRSLREIGGNWGYSKGQGTRRVKGPGYK